MKDRISWELTVGIQKGDSLISRDIETTSHPSEDAARQRYKKGCGFYKSIVYSIWFAIIVSPEGNEIRLN